MNDSEIKELIHRYDIAKHTDHVKCFPLAGYPHISKMIIDDKEYYVKKMMIGKERAEWLEWMYSQIESDVTYLHPVSNVNGGYLTKCSGEDCIRSNDQSKGAFCLVTRAQKPADLSPSAEWWADRFSGIHRMVKTDLIGMGSLRSVLENNPSIVVFPYYNSVTDGLKKADDIIEKDVRNLLESLVVDDRDEEMLSMKGVPVHGDPLHDNILHTNSGYVLYDFESSGLSLKEYDIQRLFADVATNSESDEEIETFIRTFITEYEKKNEMIDRSALDYLFRMDLIKTICWLYDAARSYERSDCKRQSYDLEKYKAALRYGTYHKVLSVIHETYQYDLSTIRIHNQKEICFVAEKISQIVPDFVGATIGGSRSHFLEDPLSDVEMYFYSDSGIPTLEDITRVLENARAKHKRSPLFLWNEEPWGPHSFFELDGLYFEIGYRIVGEVKGKITDYLLGKKVEPQRDCHDLGLGYLYSGLAASIQAEKIVTCYGEAIIELKELSNRFPDTLRDTIIEEYYNTARNLIEGKLRVAVERQDSFFYTVLSTRVIRCLMITAFSITKTHFPGDKWNEVLLKRTRWKDKEEFLDILNHHMGKAGNCAEKYRLIVRAYKMIEKEMEAQ